MHNKTKDQLVVYCPKCGYKIKDRTESDGAIKIHCKCCKLFMCSKPMNQRELSIRVIMPSPNYQLNNQRL